MIGKRWFSKHAPLVYPLGAFKGSVIPRRTKVRPVQRAHQWRGLWKNLEQ